jgi:PKD domain
MGERLPRVAVWGLLVLVLASVLATVPGALATSTPTYSLLGYVDQPTGLPVVSGVAVDLISGATHQVYTTTTLVGTSGGFNFSSASNAAAMRPGWWGLWVPPQAHVKPTGSATSYAILPASQNPTYAYENVSDLTTTSYPSTISGVSETPYNAVIWGNATYNGRPVGGATVQLLDPTFNGAVFANNTTLATGNNTTAVGEFSLSVPSGTWVLETTVPGSPAYINYTQVTVSSPKLTVNPVLSSSTSYLTWGFSNQAAHPGSHVPSGGNVTLFDPTDGDIYSAVTPAGGYYEVGSYPAGFNGPGSQTFDVILSNVGYGTAWYPLTVSSSNYGGPNPHNVLVPTIAPPAVYTTTLTFTHGFNKLTVNSSAALGNDSTFPDLANASVGQLWAQLALDWQSNTTFSMANFPTLVSWLNSSGPFFPAGQAQLTVNGTGFGQPTNYSFADSTTCASFCGLGSNASIHLAYGQAYNTTAKVATTSRAYSLSFNFRHPTHAQAFNYTVHLPAGYVLSASSVSAPPAQTWIRPAGPGGTFTSFTLVSNASASASGTAALTVVKSGNVTANVNATVTNFTFSKYNVLNDSTGNYTVIVGTGENVTFSAANSTFPAQTSGVQYAWNFGDGANATNTTPLTNHTYNTAGVYHGSVKVTGSGGQSNSTTFTVYASSAAPTVVISVNNTTTLKDGENYTIVNWSSTLHFNATSSLLPLTGTPQHDVLSVTLFNLTAYKSSWLENFSWSAGANASQNWSYTFLGAGHYMTAGLVGTGTVAFLGWQYNLTVTIWDAAGHTSTTKLVILVRDTEKPVPVARVLNSAGKSITSITESANHTAYVALSATNSSDPHNGSISWFNWSVTNNANNSANESFPIQEKTLGSVPANKVLWLAPQSKPYIVNLTVTDRAGNTAYTTVSLTVAVNTSTRPVLEVGNMTAPTTMTDGSTYTVWVNVTNTIGANSTAENVAVLFYLLPPSGSGNQIAVGGSPGSVVWYGYSNQTNGTVNTTSAGTGTISIPFNETFRAEIQFKPARTGNWDLWANATASNEFAANYAAGGNQAHVAITLNANPIVQDEEYIAIAAVIIIAIVAIVLFYRRRTSTPTSKSSGSKSGLERGGSKKDKDADDDDDS